jgi:hypothetical protein
MSYADSKPHGNEIYSPCKFNDKNKLPVLAESCLKFSKKEYFVIGCNGKQCLANSGVGITKERCNNRKDPGPNVNPTGMSFWAPGIGEEIYNAKNCNEKQDSTCSSIKTQAQKMFYSILKKTASYQHGFYEDSKVFAPVMIFNLKSAKSFLYLMEADGGKLSKEHPYNSGVDYLIFEDTEKDEGEKNIYSVKELKFYSAKELKIKKCE